MGRATGRTTSGGPRRPKPKVGGGSRGRSTVITGIEFPEYKSAAKSRAGASDAQRPTSDPNTRNRDKMNARAEMIKHATLVPRRRAQRYATDMARAKVRDTARAAREAFVGPLMRKRRR